MNLGFLGLQFSFGLQQGNMGPIYSYLGADEASLPLLQLAGPVTGLMVQPLVGVLSDRTFSRWGRRTPYLLPGAVMCAVALLFMPFSSSVLMAVSLMWILDAGNNMTMEPYRALVKDRLDPDQHELGFLTQSAFTGLAHMFAFLAPTLLVHGLGMNRDSTDTNNIPYVTHICFAIGATLSIATILWSIHRVPEDPPSPTERAAMQALPRSPRAVIGEIVAAMRAMPGAMRRMALMCLFQWYAMSAYWVYVIYAIARSVYDSRNPRSPAFHEAVLTNGQVAAFYNGVAVVAAFAMAPVARRHGAHRVHAACLTFAGLGMLLLPFITTEMLLFIPAIGIGLGWASMMGNPYVILADAIPPHRTGVYMGIFNMFIVVPMLLFAATMPLYYDSFLNGDARHALMLAGALMLMAAVTSLWVPKGMLRPRRTG